METGNVSPGGFASNSSIWILGTWRDLSLFIGPPLFIIPLVYLAAGIWGTGDVYMFAISCAALGHHVPGLIRAYCDRALFRRFRFRFTLAPVFFLAVCLFCSSYDYSGLAVVVYLWGVWHGMMQAYGFARIYDAKIKSFEKLVCRLDFLLCFFWFVSGTLASPDRMSHIIREAYRAGVPFIQPQWLERVNLLFWLGAIIVTAIYLGFNAFQYRKGNRVSPLKFLVLLSSIGLWWITSVTIPDLLLGIAMWEIFHALQYNVIVWAHNRKRAASTKDVGSLLRILFRPQLSMVFLYGSIVLSYGGLSYVNSGLESNELKTFVTSFFIASALLHYYFDGFIWKVRDVDLSETMGIQANDSLAGSPSKQYVPLLKWLWFVLPLTVLIVLQASQTSATKTDFTGRIRLDLSRAVVTSVPLSSEARYRLGKACLERNRYGEAITHLQAAVNVRENFIDAWVDLGTAYQLRSQTDEDLSSAVNAYKKSLGYAPRLASANSNLGLILVSQQLFEEALKYLLVATEVEPNNSLMRGNLADSYFALGRYAEAAGQYRLAIKTEEDPEYRAFFEAQVARAQSASENKLGPPPRQTKRSEAKLRQSRNYSNIYAQDYVGPEVCGECHSEQYDLWKEHPHRKMNLNVDQDSMLGDFSGTELIYAEGKAKFETENNNYFMTLFQGDVAVRRYQVTRTVGSRFIQMYIGVLVMGSRSPDNRRAEAEGKLPFSYSLTRKAWYPETFDDPWHKAEFDSDGALSDAYRFYDERAGHWATNCAWCHNTYPYAERLKLPSSVTGLQDYWYGFPAKDIKFSSTLQASELTVDTVSLDPKKLVTVGISCESCHFGGRLHAQDAWPIQFVPSGPGLEFTGGSYQKLSDARKDPYVINAICAQCHSSRNPAYPDGSGTWNSREARDLNAGACASQIKCTDCHDPHTAGPTSAENVDEARFNKVCLSCHEDLADDAKRQAHAGHGDSVSVSCMDCHMPRIVHGLSDMVRSHTISKPGDPRMLAKSAPNACNLCHLDESLAWTLNQLEEKWGIKHEPGEAWDSAYGGHLDHPVGQVWLNHNVPVVRQVAVDAYSRSPLGEAQLRELVRILDDEVPANRMMGIVAMERLLKRPLSAGEYSPYANPKERREKINALVP